MTGDTVTDIPSMRECYCSARMLTVREVLASRLAGQAHVNMYLPKTCNNVNADGGGDRVGATNLQQIYQLVALRFKLAQILPRAK